MKKALILVAVVALTVWVISWFRADDAVAISAARPWPGTMGTLDDAAHRYSPQRANAAAVRLTALGKAIPKSDAVDAFVLHEISRDEPVIGHPPAIHDLSAIRDLLLHEQVVWQRDPGMGGGNEITERRAMQMTMARALVARALASARGGDPAAWEELHAVWQLARSLDGHPQVMMQTAALAMARMINAVAWKMPLPAPPWLAELQARDYVQPLLDAYQHQTASYWRDGARLFPTKWLAMSVDHDRQVAEQLLKTNVCDVKVPQNELGTDLTSVWRRVFRYRAEREASANALRVRQGKKIETASRCGDGGWSFDGTTLRFSHDIALAPPDRPMPLVLRPKAAGERPGSKTEPPRG